MEKETVILRFRASIDFGQEAKSWLNSLLYNSTNDEDNILWFAKENGKHFLSEYQGSWKDTLIEETEDKIHKYFIELKLEEKFLPKTKIIESYSGSWVMEAAVTMPGSIGGIYALITGISEIAVIVEGLTRLKDSIANKFTRRINAKAFDLISERCRRYNLPSPPENILHTKDFVMDARPLASIKPSEMKTHSIHLHVSVSQNIFTLENVGAKTIRDIEIGLFAGKNKKNYWSLSDSYISFVNILPPKQTISKPISDFVHTSDKLTISDLPVHVDCWVQDAFGIYLFNFYLDK